MYKLEIHTKTGARPLDADKEEEEEKDYKTRRVLPELCLCVLGAETPQSAALVVDGRLVPAGRNRWWVAGGNPLSTAPDALTLLCQDIANKLGARPMPTPLLHLFANGAGKPMPDDTFSLKGLAEGVELYAYQHEIVSRLLATSRHLLAAECGTGKTIMSIATIIGSGSKRALIVCPASLVANWIAEITRFAPSLDVGVVRSKKLIEGVLCEQDVTIVSYTLSSAVVEHVKALPKAKRDQLVFDIAVFDEAHYVKNAGSKRAKAALYLRKRSRRAYLLTATPCVSHESLYNLLRILDPQQFKSFHHFQPTRAGAAESVSTFFYGERYTLPEVVHVCGGRKQLVFKRNRRANELSALVSLYCTRARKADLLDLPELIRERVVVGRLNKRQQKAVDDGLMACSLLAETKGRLYANAALMQLLRDTIAYKTKSVIAYMKEVIAEPDHEKVIVFTHHRVLQGALKEALDALGRQCIVINGDVKQGDREGLLKTFADNPSVNVALLSLGCAATGLNLTCASLVLCAELVFNATTHVQAESRAHRIGAKRAVVYQYLCLEGNTDEHKTTDDIVFTSLCSKTRAESGVLDNDSGGGGSGGSGGSGGMTTALTTAALALGTVKRAQKNEKKKKRGKKRKRTINE